MLKAVFDFLFGKDPKIFNKKGEVEHDLGPKVWEAWQNKNLGNSEYNWRNHQGTRGKSTKRSSSSS